MPIQSFEDWGFVESRPPHLQPLKEALDPSRMVAWYNRQTQEIQRRLEAEKSAGGNPESALKLQTLLNTWTNPKYAITSSLNIECFDALGAACKQYAEADLDWKHHGFLAALYDNLTQAVAKLEASGMVGNGTEDGPADPDPGAPAGMGGPSAEPPPDQPDVPGAEAPGGEAGSSEEEEQTPPPPPAV